MDGRTVRYVRAGACVDEGTGDVTHCAFDATDCESYSAKFVSGDRQHVCSNDPRKKVDIAIGRCVSDLDGRQCTSSSSGCFFPNRFTSQDENCNLLYDYQEDMKTHFGVCWNPHVEDVLGLHANSPDEFCAWSKDDCPEGHEYTTINAVYGLEWMMKCFCKDVNVGACSSDSSRHLYCAVSGEACAFGHTWIPAFDVMRRTDIVCRLCESELERPPKPTTVSTKDEEHDHTAEAGTNPATVLTSDGGHDRTVVVGTSLGILTILALSVLTIAVFLMRRRHKQELHQGSDDDGNVPSAIEDRSIT